MHHNSDEIGLLHIQPNLSDLPSESAAFYPLVVVESKLGISFQHLTALLSEAHKRYVLVRDAKGAADLAELEQVSRVLILIKPDHYTAMNTRKQLITSGQISIENELLLLELMFTIPKHSKSSIAWHHRQWIYKLKHSRNDPQSRLIDHINIEHELQLCDRTITLYPKGYYTWNYRHWLLSTMESDHHFVQKEYHHSRSRVEVNVSDHSCLQHLELALFAIVKDSPLKISILEDHLRWLDGVIISYPGHEALWYHRRYCLDILLCDMKDSIYYSQKHYEFIEDIAKGDPSPLAIDTNRSSLLRQVELALHFGVWLCLKEKDTGNVNIGRARSYLNRLESTPAISEIHRLFNDSA
ncbi:hypothetical protein PHYBLDRAFT_168046 [Phycomyces blakesleeanus NRRL 1555(-)]|uniref:Uncharacterized protein n=1 Tax=Phycomyces blakesleeanus (strain ATCC 8743b / DSM 1359 / FGSC 10004 / NBRC 33097 / NRRL 1555) TaxID=763407 RepID=A0A162NEN7_PHYB8|nr:hypothetical protein PHYBLDRAFT_168046 [Phycomyces blakesleeanus NRRL 1555(-)]OAD73608.1 hypothetical protein PHYBLDRAFT_168046 [Phycomyces blakesleeanus NRRL 1555(-)]|eukprot:XP_018291648.1 hypothetical protein PHYBLDRAFT_168046 [Phycomyces blakesleeanus NRRL 1555(-)]